MTEYNLTAQNWRVSVCWLTKKKGELRVVEIEYENDLSGALALYCKAKAAGKKFVTLRSCNVGFPPPPKYRPREVQVLVRKKVRGRTRKVRETRYKEPMHEVNLKGIWWCPYCMTFRKFEAQDGFEIDGVIVPHAGIHCQICGVSHRDGHVRKWNPVAQKIPYDTKPTRARRSNGSKRRRTRKR